MKSSRLIALGLLIIMVGGYFHLQPAIEHFAWRIADIPEFTDRTSNPAFFEFAVRAMYLLAIIGLVRVLVQRPRRD